MIIQINLTIINKFNYSPKWQSNILSFHYRHWFIVIAQWNAKIQLLSSYSLIWQFESSLTLSFVNQLLCCWVYCQTHCVSLCEVESYVVWVERWVSVMPRISVVGKEKTTVANAACIEIKVGLFGETHVNTSNW